MNVMIVASRNCSHYPKLARELDDPGVSHEIVCAEDRPEPAQRYGIRSSPHLVVDGNVTCRGRLSFK